MGSQNEWHELNVSGINIDVDPLANGFVSNSEPPSGLNRPCFTYHSKSHKMITWSYDPGADKWATIPTTGVSPTRSSPNGAYQKCAYLEDVDLFVGTNDEKRGVFAIRAALE